MNSTINGRTLLSSGNEGHSLRKMNFNVFPSNVLSGVRVAKGATAARPEGGLAGQVDLQTLRPLDVPQLRNKSSSGSVSVNFERRDLYDDDGLRLEGVYAWRNEDETFGIFFGGVLSEESRHPCLSEAWVSRLFSRHFVQIFRDFSANHTWIRRIPASCTPFPISKRLVVGLTDDDI